MALKYKM